VGSQLTIPLIVRNESRLGEANVNFKAATLEPISPNMPVSRLQFDMSEIPQVKVGQNVEIKVSGPAPSSLDAQSKPLEYRLIIDATAEEGVLVPTQRVGYSIRTFSFWNDAAWEYKLMQMGLRTGRIDITFYVGTERSAGFHGQIVSETIAPPDTNSVVIASGGKPLGQAISARVVDGYITKFEFQTDSTRAFQRYPIVIFFTLKEQMTKQQWSAAAAKLRINLE